MEMTHVLATAKTNQDHAWRLIRDLRIVDAWKSIGAQVNLVGSLKTGLLVRHLDIDFHVYTDDLDMARSFQAVSRLAVPALQKLECGNLIGTEEDCIEWHAWFGQEDRLWQVDMIHIRRGSTYDGYFERVAERISAVLTEETRNAILCIKYSCPPEWKVMGIEYYVAVLRDGVRNFDQFTAWRQEHPAEGIINWMP